MRLVKVPFEEAVPFENYLTEMKHGWIEGQWDPEDEVCNGYYWRDMEWYPHALYKIVDSTNAYLETINKQETCVVVRLPDNKIKRFFNFDGADNNTASLEGDLRRQETLVQVLTERLTSAIHRLETIQETHPDICLDEDLKYLRGFDNGI